MDTDCSARFPDAPDLRCIDFRCSVPEPEIEAPPDPNAAGGPCVEDADCPAISYCDQGACRYREGYGSTAPAAHDEGSRDSPR